MKSFSLLTALFVLINNAFSQNADSAKFYYQKAIIEKDAKRYLVASALFEKAINFDSKYTAAYLEEGYVNLAMRKTDAAKGYFTKLYELDTTNITAIKELTVLYISTRPSTCCCGSRCSTANPTARAKPRSC